MACRIHHLRREHKAPNSFDKRPEWINIFISMSKKLFLPLNDCYLKVLFVQFYKFILKNVKIWNIDVLKIYVTILFPLVSFKLNVPSDGWNDDR